MRNKLRSFYELSPEESAKAILDTLELSDNATISLRDIQDIFEFYNFTILTGMTDRIYCTNQVITLSPDNSVFANKYILAFFLYLYCYKEGHFNEYEEYATSKFFNRLNWVEVARFISALLIPEGSFREKYEGGMFTKEELGEYFLECGYENVITATNLVKIRAKFLGLVK